MNPLLIPKEDQKTPDNYGCLIKLITGQLLDFELVSHSFVEKTRCFELVDSKGIVRAFPVSSILFLEFDGRFRDLLDLAKSKIANQGV